MVFCVGKNGSCPYLHIRSILHMWIWTPCLISYRKFRTKFFIRFSFWVFVSAKYFTRYIFVIVRTIKPKHWRQATIMRDANGGLGWPIARAQKEREHSTWTTNWNFIVRTRRMRWRDCGENQEGMEQTLMDVRKKTGRLGWDSFATLCRVFSSTDSTFSKRSGAVKYFVLFQLFYNVLISGRHMLWLI